MTKYRKINPQKWNDPRVKKLSRAEPNGQTLFWFLLTGPQTGIVPGLYEARAGGLADYLGWSREDFDRMFAELEEQGLAEADWNAGLVWVPSAIEVDSPQSSNAAKSWGTAVEELPDCPLKDKGFRHVLAFLEDLHQGFAQAFAKASAIQITDKQITDRQIPDKPKKVGKPTETGKAGSLSKKKPKQPVRASSSKKKEPTTQTRPNVERLKQAREEANRKVKASGERVGPTKNLLSSDPALFGLGEQERKELMVLLEGTIRKTAKKNLRAAIKAEVIRVYKLLRKEAVGSDYVKMGRAGHWAALDFGIACIGHGFTPEEVIEFWQDPANNYTHTGFPPLTFLGNEKNLDAAAMSIKPAKSGKAGKRHQLVESKGHSYDSSSDLHPGVRSALVSAGCDVADLTDRELLSVQNAAKGLASGRNPFLGKTKRMMAEAVVSLFKGGS